MHAELDPATYGLTIWDLDREFLTGGEVGIYATVGGVARQQLGDILHVLRDAYCRTIGIEYMHIQEPEEKRWIQEQVEGASSKLDVEDQRHILGKLNAAEALEKFLATKYLGQKRFGLEGAESLIPILDAILEEAADTGMDSAVHGHAAPWPAQRAGQRGGQVLRPALPRVRGLRRPRLHPGLGRREVPPGPDGHVRQSRAGNEMPVDLAANPSHLEAVNPVVEGMCRARMDQIPHDRSRRFPVLRHPDARRRRLRRARAWWPRRSTCRSSRATGSAAPST